MKTLNFFLAFLMLFLTNCSKDEISVEDNKQKVLLEAFEKEPLKVNDNSQEERDIPLSIIEKGVTVKNARKINGSLPKSNTELDFEIENSQSAFLKAGFEFEIKVPLNYAGSYIQFQSTDGSQKSSSYFNVPLGSFSSTKKLENKSSKFIGQEIPNLNPNSTEKIKVVVRVNFKETVLPGKFCYAICIYDSEGNISFPETICVEVETWGGNNDILGNWELQKRETTIGENVTVLNSNETKCLFPPESNLLVCEDGVSLEYFERTCETSLGPQLEIKSDGTQSSISEFIAEIFDYETSKKECEELFQTDVSKIESSGNWAYDEENKKIIFINFINTQTFNGEIFPNNLSEFGINAELISVSSTSLIIQEIFTVSINDEDSNEEEIQTNSKQTKIVKYFYTK